MATNRDLLKEAIADAKAVKETAIANAKAALEEAFTPYLKEKLSAKLAEMEDDENESMYETEMEDEVMMENNDMEMEDMEEISLDELLAELEDESEMKDEELYEAKEKEEEEEVSIEDMSEDDLKSFIEDVIKDMVSAGELEAGHEGMENEEGTEEHEAGESEEEEAGEMEMGDEDELDEEINIDELLAELEETSYKTKAKDSSPRSKNAIFSKGNDEYHTDETEEDDAPYSKKKATDISFMDEELDETAADSLGLTDPQMIAGLSGLGAALIAKLASLAKKDKEAAKKAVEKAISGDSEMKEQLDELRDELNEVNLLNAKLLYTNKIFRNKSLNETQKVKVLTAFDKASTKKEVELVYDTLLESLKVSNTKAPIKESMGSASKVLGNAASKPIIENDAFARMRELAFGGKK